MSFSSFAGTFRFKLVVPVAVAMLAAIFAAIGCIVLSQKRGNEHLNNRIIAAFQRTGEEINTKLTDFSGQLNDKLTAMNSAARGELSTSSIRSLQKASESMNWRMKKVYENSAEGFALLLAQVSLPAFVATDKQALSAYAAVGKRNPDIVLLSSLMLPGNPLLLKVDKQYAGFLNGKGVV
jgi:hypothetical protein